MFRALRPQSVCRSKSRMPEAALSVRGSRHGIAYSAPEALRRGNPLRQSGPKRTEPVIRPTAIGFRGCRERRRPGRAVGKESRDLSYPDAPASMRRPPPAARHARLLGRIREPMRAPRRKEAAAHGGPGALLVAQKRARAHAPSPLQPREARRRTNKSDRAYCRTLEVRWKDRSRAGRGPGRCLRARTQRARRSGIAVVVVRDSCVSQAGTPEERS